MIDNDNNNQDQDQQDEFSSLDELGKTSSTNQDTDKNKDKDNNDPLASKTPEELRKMYKDSQDFIKRQADEVAFARKIAEQATQVLNRDKSSNPQPKEPTDELTDVDFIVDPKKAVDKAVANHPAVKQAEQSLIQQRQLQAQQKLLSEHPDVREILVDSEFQEFLRAKPSKAKLLTIADQTMDPDLVSDVLNDFKATRKAKADTAANVLEDGRKEDLKAGINATGRGKGTSKPIFRRRDIVDLMRKDPRKYEAMYPEIMEAYAEDRVR